MKNINTRSFSSFKASCVYLGTQLLEGKQCIHSRVGGVWTVEVRV